MDDEQKERLTDILLEMNQLIVDMAGPVFTTARYLELKRMARQECGQEIFNETLSWTFKLSPAQDFAGDQRADSVEHNRQITFTKDDEKLAKEMKISLGEPELDPTGETAEARPKAGPPEIYRSSDPRSVSEIIHSILLYASKFNLSSRHFAAKNLNLRYKSWIEFPEEEAQLADRKAWKNKLGELIAILKGLKKKSGLLELEYFFKKVFDAQP